MLPSISTMAVDIEDTYWEVGGNGEKTFSTAFMSATVLQYEYI